MRKRKVSAAAAIKKGTVDSRNKSVVDNDSEATDQSKRRRQTGNEGDAAHANVDDAKEVVVDDMRGDEDDDEKGTTDDGDSDDVGVTKENDDDAFPNSKYEVRQRVIARDEDGLMYHANIRRKMCGINHQKSVSCLKIFDSFPSGQVKEETSPSKLDGEKGDDDDVKERNDDEPEWYYFVHFEGWKSLWDRWVSESDVMEASPVNEDRMKETSQAHRSLQFEFKEKTKKRKIQNAGLFMQLWKQRLDGINERWKKQDQKGSSPETNEKKQKVEAKKKAAAKPKKKFKSEADVIEEQSRLAAQSCLTNRSQAHIQAIPLAFGLKRILVEDWEILNASTRNHSDDGIGRASDDSMVHVLPAKVTVRHALSMYLQEKGITWDGQSKPSIPATKQGELNENEQTQDVVKDASKDTSLEPNENGPEESPKSINNNDEAHSPKGGEGTCLKQSSSLTDHIQKAVLSEEADDVVAPTPAEGPDQLTKEWIDMADGIALYFEQALKMRLLYPSEISQLALLEEGESEESQLDKVDVYGCEHLLRLISIMPRILDQQYEDAKKKRLERKHKTSAAGVKVEDVDNEDESFAEVGGVILAKLQDLARFLQKNQSTLFCSRYRKKTDKEVKLDRKIHKRQERRLKNKFASLLQQAAPAGQQQEEGDSQSGVTENEDKII